MKLYRFYSSKTEYDWLRLQCTRSLLTLPCPPDATPARAPAVCLVTASIKCDNVRVRGTFAYLYCDLVTLWLAHCHRQPADKWCQCFVPDTRPTAQFVLTVSLLQNVSTIFRGNLREPAKNQNAWPQNFHWHLYVSKDHKNLPSMKIFEDKHPNWLDWCLNACL